MKDTGEKIRKVSFFHFEKDMFLISKLNSFFLYAKTSGGHTFRLICLFPRFDFLKDRILNTNNSILKSPFWKKVIFLFFFLYLSCRYVNTIIFSTIFSILHICIIFTNTILWDLCSEKSRLMFTNTNRIIFDILCLSYVKFKLEYNFVLCFQR